MRLEHTLDLNYIKMQSFLKRNSKFPMCLTVDAECNALTDDFHLTNVLFKYGRYLWKQTLAKGWVSKILHSLVHVTIVLLRNTSSEFEREWNLFEIPTKWRQLFTSILLNCFLSNLNSKSMLVYLYYSFIFISFLGNFQINCGCNSELYKFFIFFPKMFKNTGSVKNLKNDGFSV